MDNAIYTKRKTHTHKSSLFSHSIAVDFLGRDGFAVFPNGSMHALIPDRIRNIKTHRQLQLRKLKSFFNSLLNIDEVFSLIVSKKASNRFCGSRIMFLRTLPNVLSTIFIFDLGNIFIISSYQKRPNRSMSSVDVFRDLKWENNLQICGLPK